MRPWSRDEIEALPGHFYEKTMTVWNILAEKKK
jgi:hypothetical protein